MASTRLGLSAALVLVVAGAGPAAAKDKISVRLNNPTTLEWKVEVRDMVCDGAVVWQGRIRPGAEAKLTACADDRGAAKLATAVMAGCASAKQTVYEAIADGDIIDVAQAKQPE